MDLHWTATDTKRSDNITLIDFIALDNTILLWANCPISNIIVGFNTTHQSEFSLLQSPVPWNAHRAVGQHRIVVRYVKHTILESYISQDQSLETINHFFRIDWIIFGQLFELQLYYTIFVQFFFNVFVPERCQSIVIECKRRFVWHPLGTHVWYAFDFSVASSIWAVRKSTRIDPGQVAGAINCPVGLTISGPASLYEGNIHISRWIAFERALHLRFNHNFEIL